MNIYIYGGETFKKKIHTVLDHGNIKFKIEDGEVIDINNLTELQDSIKEYPDEIFLIDQEKIIENDFITKYLKFLIPKDGIKREFLDENGTGDVNLRTLEELMFYLVKRIESAKKARPKAHDITSIDDMFDLFEDDMEDILSDRTKST
ncbi:MAG: hypothetical protein U9R16_01480 [Campylobacterota bacterium]|nr:hypothetical protein [Campylobacterota bacterium]